MNARSIALLLAVVGPFAGICAHAMQSTCTLKSNIDYYGLATCSGVTVNPPCPISDGSNYCLDVRTPSPLAPFAPTILYVHGGGWNGGKKDAPDDTIVCDLLCQAGYPVVSCNYTLACTMPAVPPAPAYAVPSYPQAIKDVRAAIAWIRTTGQAPPYKLPQCIVLVGASAGGHLAAMAGALNDNLTDFVPSGPTADLSVQLTITFSGDYDLYRRGLVGGTCPGCPAGLGTPGSTCTCTGLPHTHCFVGTNCVGDPITERFIGQAWTSVGGCPSGNPWNYTCPNHAMMTSNNFLNASPAHWAHPTSSPFYMFHSTQDRFFPTEGMQWMQEALNTYGVSNRSITENSCGHALDIYTPAGTAPVIIDVITNWTGYAHCH